MPIEVWSINLRRSVHNDADKEGRLLGWLDDLRNPATELPDVLAMTDFRVELSLYLGRFHQFAFAAMTDHLITSADESLFNDRQLVGIGIASQHKLLNRAKPFTHGDGILRPLQGVAKNDRIRKDSVGDDEIDNSEARRCVAIMVETGEERIPLGTTHGYWVRDGVFTPGQQASTARMIRHFSAYARANGGLVAFADWNLDGKGIVHRMILESGAREHELPADCRTTMATELGKRLGLKPDRIFQWPDAKGVYRYNVDNIHLSDAPGSDHLMLCGTVGFA